LFDPDWNPASDKQAAGRIWREGQKKKCFIYRFMSTCSIEEKIIQRQLCKEGLQNIVENKEQVNVFSTGELKSLFKSIDTDVISDTHDTLKCTRCKSVKRKTESVAQRHMLTVDHVNICCQMIETFKSQLITEANNKEINDAVESFVVLDEVTNTIEN
jgi:hypothetical protein